MSDLYEFMINNTSLGMVKIENGKFRSVLEFTIDEDTLIDEINQYGSSFHMFRICRQGERADNRKGDSDEASA